LRGDSGIIRIGENKTHAGTYVAAIFGKTANANGTATPVYIDSTGHLGTLQSSARFKEAFKPMDKASEASWH
jgi:hypothetical protein